MAIPLSPLGQYFRCPTDRNWPSGDRINQGLFRAFDPALEAGFRRPTTSSDHAMISASPAPMCITWTTEHDHFS
jgi:hypothetical protein